MRSSRRFEGPKTINVLQLCSAEHDTDIHCFDYQLCKSFRLQFGPCFPPQRNFDQFRWTDRYRYSIIPTSRAEWGFLFPFPLALVSVLDHEFLHGYSCLENCVYYSRTGLLFPWNVAVFTFSKACRKVAKDLLRKLVLRYRRVNCSTIFRDKGKTTGMKRCVVL